MNANPAGNDHPPRSFRLYPGKGANGRVMLAAGIFWFMLSSFIAAPFSEIWGFYLSCAFIFALALMLSNGKAQFMTGMFFLIISVVLCYLGFKSD
jgi:hypothetical protein